MDERAPRVFDLLGGEALETWSTRYGVTGRVFTGQGIEAVWVTKAGEDIDPDWFAQPVVDLLVVMRGHLRVEFADSALEDRTLAPGQMLILTANTRCRAYRWPRDSREPTVFLAVYPRQDSGPER